MAAVRFFTLILLLLPLSAQAKGRTSPKIIKPSCETYLHKGDGPHPLVGLSAEVGDLKKTIKIVDSIKTKMGYQLVYHDNAKVDGYTIRRLQKLIQDFPVFAKNNQLQNLDKDRIAVPDLDLVNKISEAVEVSTGKRQIYILPVKGRYSADEFISHWADRILLESIGDAEHFHDVLIHRYGFLLMPNEYLDLTSELAALIKSFPKISNKAKDWFVYRIDLDSPVIHFESGDRLAFAVSDKTKQRNIALRNLIDEIRGYMESSGLQGYQSRLRDLEKRAWKLDADEMAEEVLHHLIGDNKNLKYGFTK